MNVFNISFIGNKFLIVYKVLLRYTFKFHIIVQF